MLSERSAHVGESDGDADDQSHVRPASSALLEGDSPRPINDSDDLFARRDELPTIRDVFARSNIDHHNRVATKPRHSTIIRYEREIRNGHRLILRLESL